MAKINVRPGQLENASSKLQRLSDDLQSNIIRMERLRGQVEGAWRSKYTMQYLEEMNTVKQNIQRLSEQTEQVSKVMRQTASEIRRIEKENAQLFIR